MKRFCLLVAFLFAAGSSSYSQPFVQGTKVIAEGIENSVLRSAALFDFHAFVGHSPELFVRPSSLASFLFSPRSFPLVTAAQLRPYALLSKQNVDAFIFDLDGTLLDSLGAWENAASNYLKTRGIDLPPNLQTEVEKMSLLDGARLLKEQYHFEESPEELVAATIRPVGEHYYQDIPAKSQVPLLLSYLHSQGVKMAVATASHADFARGALERLGLMDYFEFIITCDEVGIGKTDPRVYEVARERLGTAKARTVVVEDAPYALETAHEAGFKTIGVKEKHYQKQTEKVRKIVDLLLDLDK